MTIPVILKKNGKLLNRFNSIKELSEHIGWDYYLLCHYIKKNKKTLDGFEFEYDMQRVWELQKNIQKKIQEHRMYFMAAGNEFTAKYHVEQYIAYADEMLENCGMYPQSIAKLEPIINNFPSYRYWYKVSGIEDYNKKLKNIQAEFAKYTVREMTVLRKKQEVFSKSIQFIMPKHIEEFLTIGKDSVKFDVNGIEKQSVATYNREERLSLMCLKQLSHHLLQKRDKKKIDDDSVISYDDFDDEDDN